jgi:hypothetical protein
LRSFIRASPSVTQIKISNPIHGFDDKLSGEGTLSVTILAAISLLVPAEDPLIANVVRMLITVHRQLDLFEAFGLDTLFEVGLVSVEPTHTGRGENTSYE